MKARLCLVASVLLFAGQALAEEPLATPKSDPGLPAPPPAATEPAPAPAPQTEAMTPAPEPQKDAATPAPEPQKEAATPAPAPAPQQQAEVPAEVVITELTAVDDQKKLVKPWALPVDRVAEMDVYDAKGNKIGEVDAVLQDKKGRDQRHRRRARRLPRLRRERHDRDARSPEAQGRRYRHRADRGPVVPAARLDEEVIARGAAARFEPSHLVSL